MFAVNCNKAVSKGFGELQTQAKQWKFYMILFSKVRNMRSGFDTRYLHFKVLRAPTTSIIFWDQRHCQRTHVQQINFYVTCDLTIVQEINIVLQTIALRYTRQFLGKPLLLTNDTWLFSATLDMEWLLQL